MTSEQLGEGWTSRGVAAVAVGAGVAVGVTTWFAWERIFGKTGKGTKVLSSGDVYVGDLVRGKAHGFGTSTSPTGEVLTGTWEDDEAHGSYTVVGPFGTMEGVATKQSGKNGCRWRGTIKTLDGTKMEVDGECVLGSELLTGTVVIRDSSDTLKFRGLWVDNMAEGECECVDQDGSFVGLMHKGKREGHGELHTSAGHVYVGNWSDNYKHGKGTMRYADGQTYEGTWNMGQWADGELVSADGARKTVFNGSICK